MSILLQLHATPDVNSAWQRLRLRRPAHQQNTHDFADGRKNMNDIFNNYVCSAAHMCSGLHFQNV